MSGVVVCLQVPSSVLPFGAKPSTPVRAVDGTVAEAEAEWRFHITVRADQGGRRTLVVARTDAGASAGWGRELVFRVRTKPRMIIDGKSPKLGVFGQTNALSRDVLSACYLQSGHVLSGGPNGCITVWDGVKSEWQRAQAQATGAEGSVLGGGGHRAYRAMGEQYAHRAARNVPPSMHFNALRLLACTHVMQRVKYSMPVHTGTGRSFRTDWFEIYHTARFTDYSLCTAVRQRESGKGTSGGGDGSTTITGAGYGDWVGGGVGSLRVHPQYEDQLLSAGGDGIVKQWAVGYEADRSDAWLGGHRVVLQPLRVIGTLKDDLSRGVDRGVGVGRALLSVDWCRQRRNVCMVADGENDIWLLPEPKIHEPSQADGTATTAATLEAEALLPPDEWADDSQALRPEIEGQSGDVLNVAVHPTVSGSFATACEDGCIYLWDGEARRSLPPSPFPVRRREAEKRERRAVSERAFSDTPPCTCAHCVCMTYLTGRGAWKRSP